MAVPESMTTRDLSGVFVLNKTLSDDTNEILTLQSVGWITRKAIGFATITLHVKHFTDEDGVEHIESDQIVTPGGIKTKEIRLLHGNEREHDDSVFGHINSKSKRIQASDIGNDHLKEGWLDDTVEHGAIHTHGENKKNNWTAEQTWGFADINGERRHVRRVYFTGPQKQIIQARLVYDYKGPLPDN